MKRIWSLAVGAATVLAATAGFAVVPPEGDGLRAKAFQHPDLYIGNSFRPVAELPVNVYRGLTSDLGRLGVDPGNAFFDLRTGRWGTLIVTRPLIPGSGVGNTVQWSALGYEAAPRGEALEQAAWDAFRAYLIDHAVELRIDPTGLGEAHVSALAGGRLIQIHVDRVHGGLPVRDTFLTATINSGNLVLQGERNWTDIELDTRPGITSEQAEATLRGHVELAATRFRAEPRLEIVPVSSQPDETPGALGDGIRHRLVWVLEPVYESGPGAWEALVDAHNGELLAFADLSHYTSSRASLGDTASRRVEGGIFPVSNDGQGDDGTLQSGFPMPFADVTLDGVPVGTTTAGGNVPSGADPGTISTALSGPFVNIEDFCGAVDESAAAGDLDLEGVAAGTDCEVPTGHSAGDTNASRTGFYELNRLVEQAQGYLPDNTWLGQPLTANMNRVSHPFCPGPCNACWDGSTVNFFRSGPSGCANTGEIAAIFDHEWGHGLDDNDANAVVSSPGETLADIFAQNRLNESCIGRGFGNSTCGGYGDPCTECTGVRDTDWANHQSGEPHDIDWALSSPSDPGGGCQGFGTQFGPCGGEVHCEGYLGAEAGWDLVHRDLQGFEGSPFDFDPNTALELGTRLTYHGSANVFQWFQCDSGAGTGDGCNADSGYLGFLAADDDNGSLEDGTPHMSAIFAAFDRHQIACPMPTVTDFGCAGAPTTAPQNLSASTFDEGMELTWDAVPGAEEYWIYRTEGVHGCDFGKALVGKTTAAEFTETGLRNGFEVFYSVVAVGASDACTSPMSACQSVIPSAGDSGIIEGTVTDSNSGEPIVGATVEGVGPVTVGDETDDAGFYRIIAPVGTYEVTASADGYDPATEPGVVVTDGVTETVGFQLDLIPVPIAEISPDSFSFELPLGATDDGTLNIGNIGLLDLEWSIAEDSVPAPLGEGEDWSDDFDSYEPGQIHGQGGWKGWDNNPAGGALVVDEQAQSTPHSVEIVGASDLVHEFENIDSGQWRVTAWQFVPSDFAGQSFFILLGDYNDGGPYQWGTQVSFDSATNQVTNAGLTGGTLPLITGQWVELRVEIDLDNDTQEFFYDGELLYSSDWTTENNGSPTEFEAIDLFAQSASAIYYDDISVTDVTVPPACADPNDVPWLSVAPGSGVTTPGSSDAVDVTVDTTGLELGEHTAHLCVTTNDPAAELVEVPVNLTVIDGTNPFIDVDPENLESTLSEDGTETQTLTVSNSGGENLDWEVTENGGLALRAPRSTRTASAPETAVAMGQAATAARGASGAAAMDLASELGSALPSLAVVNTGLGGINCDTEPGIIIHDDGTVENGYTGNPDSITEVRFVDLFTPSSYPATFSSVCVAFVTLGQTSLDFAVVVFDDDGASGAPGTELGSLAVSADGIPNAPGTPTWFSYDISSLDITVAEGSIYIGVRYDPPVPADSTVFTGADESADNPPGFAGGFWWNNSDAIWIPIQDAVNGFPEYRSLMVRAVESAGEPIDCTLPDWLSVDPTSGSVPADGSQSVDVTFDAAGLAPGAYEATICLTSNAVNSSLLEVPVSLEVVEGAAVFEAASLEVDTAADSSDGNGVFEPGEQVDVVPGWRNDGTIVSALSGTAASFTGPAGATYTLVDDGADYGEIGIGDTATCTDGADCYEMSVDAPAVRPATHWVATFDESLSDGTDKTWMLHIGDSFTDVPRSNLFYTSIETLLGSGVTGGCGDGSAYCPGDTNTRSQMPAFMLKALEGPGYTPPACDTGDERLFDDVPASNLFCSWIEELANRGIVSGCDDDNYCPSAAVTRAQMAIFLLKTLEGSDYTPEECSSQFDDVPCPSLFADWIEDLAGRGITQGCSATEYCPSDTVTRGQMAAFVTKTFGFTLYGP